MVADPALSGWLNGATLDQLDAWGAPVGAIIAIMTGFILVGRRRRLLLDEVFAAVALLTWIAVDRVNNGLFGGIEPDLPKIWGVRAATFGAMAVAYAIARNHWDAKRRRPDGPGT